MGSSIHSHADANKIKPVLVFIIISIFFSYQVRSQIITYDFPVAHHNLRITVDEASCHDCESVWLDDYNCDVWEGISYDPAGDLYGMDGNPPYAIYQLDPLTSNCIHIMSPPVGNPDMHGLLAVGNGIFYTMEWENDILYRWDATAGTITVVGSTGFPNWGEICMSNGEAYYVSREWIPPNTASIVKLDLVNPANSVKVVDMDPTFGLFALTATPDPNSLYSLELWLTGGADLYRISLLDGSLTYICKANPPGIGGAFPNISSPLEHNLISPGPPFIDLDCDDSSGATGSNYNSLPYDCLSEGSHIIDIDPRIRSDAIISEMTVKILAPIPDFPNEILELGGASPGINVIGVGSNMLTFTNTGSGTLNGFLQMLSYVLYRNESYNITPGLRTIEVQFTSQLGTLSNKAKAYIDVDELPHVEVDLGPDITACEGESILLSVNNPGEEYLWSTGEDTEDITVTESGIYIVTVTSATHCPNRDTIQVDFLPVINLWLVGDTAVCQDETVNLILNTDAPFPIDVSIE